MTPLRRSLACRNFWFAIVISAGIVAPGPSEDLPSDRFTEYLNRGVAQYQVGDYQRAMDQFTQALLLKPHHPEVQKYVITTGQLIVENGTKLERFPTEQLQGIISQAERLMRNRSDQMERTLRQLKISYEQSKRNDPKALLEACRGVDMLMDVSLGDDPESLEIKTYLHSLCGNLESSAHEGKIAEGNLHRVWGYIAFCYSKWEWAVKEWEAALEAFPNDSQLRKLLSYARDHQRKEDEQAQVQAKMTLATRYLRSGDTGAAIELLQEILALDPTNEKAFDLLEKSQEKFRETTRKASIRRLEQRASEARKKENWVEAAKNYLSIFDLDPLHPSAGIELEKIQSNLSSHVAKLSAGRESSGGGKEESEKFYIMGLTDYSKGDLHSAVEKFKLSVQSDPLNGPAQKALERVQRELGLSP